MCAISFRHVLPQTGCMPATRRQVSGGHWSSRAERASVLNSLAEARTWQLGRTNRSHPEMLLDRARSPRPRALDVPRRTGLRIGAVARNERRSGRHRQQQPPQALVLAPCSCTASNVTPRVSTHRRRPHRRRRRPRRGRRRPWLGRAHDGAEDRSPVQARRVQERCARGQQAGARRVQSFPRKRGAARGVDRESRCPRTR